MTRLALLRHGHTAWNREHRIQGRSDIPLDQAARDALAALDLPPPWTAARLVSSPLSRARATAHLVAGRAPDEIVPSLTEMHWGDWEGQHGAQLRADPHSGFRDIEEWGWDYCPPGGESPAQVRARLLPWLDALTEDTLAVTHIGIMRVLLAIAHSWDFSGPCPFAIKRNRLYVLECQGAEWRAETEPVRLLDAPS